MDDTILRVDDIQKFYGNKGNLTNAVDHISFSVRKGEFLGIMGSSGSGKTTLLNCISTIDTVTSGHIYVEGKDITTLHGSQLADFRGKKLGFIFQDFNLLDTLTAYENISLALSIAGTKPSEIQKCVPQIAKALNIQEVLNKYLYQMSAGSSSWSKCHLANRFYCRNNKIIVDSQNDQTSKYIKESHERNQAFTYGCD